MLGGVSTVEALSDEPLSEPRGACRSPLRRTAHHALLLAVGVGVLGLASAAWLYTSYNWAALTRGGEPLVSFGDALGTGLMDWALWAPLYPVARVLSRRMPVERGRRTCALLVQVAAGPVLSLLQLALFALASVGLRALLYEQAPGLAVSEIVGDALADAFHFKFKSGILVVWLGLLALHLHRLAAGTRDPAAGIRPARRSRPEPHPSPLVGHPGRDERLVAGAGGRVAVLRFEDIDWIEAAANYLRIHAGGRVHLGRGTLEGLLERARRHGFVRVHRSHLVRTGAVVGLVRLGSGDLELELRGGARVRASRRYRAALEPLWRKDGARPASDGGGFP